MKKVLLASCLLTVWAGGALLTGSYLVPSSLDSGSLALGWSIGADRVWAAPAKKSYYKKPAPKKYYKPARKYKPAPQSCKANLVMDYETGRVLEQNNGYTAARPASVTKLMTTWVVFRAIEQGRISWNDRVTISTRSASTGGSSMYLKAGERLTVRELFGALLVRSGNDAAVALAEHTAGNVERFVSMMNREARILGLKSASWISPHGLPPAKGRSPDLISPHDVATLSRALLDRYPEVLQTTSKKTVKVRNGKTTLVSSNKLLWNVPNVDGLKTGWYQLAGFNIAATARDRGRRVIAVVMGCSNRLYRDKVAQQLLAAGLLKSTQYAAERDRQSPQYSRQRDIREQKGEGG